MAEANKTKSILLLLGGLAVIIILIYAMKWAQPNTSTDNTDNTDNNEYTESINVTNAQELTMADSKTALGNIAYVATIWSSDAQMISCNGSATVDINTGVYGYAAGEFANWNCYVYSKSKSQDTTITWNSGITETNAAHITYNEGSTANISDRGYYNVNDFISSTEALTTAVNNGFNLDLNYPAIGFGSYSARADYGTKPVWEIHEYQIANPDTEIRTYFIDAVSGKLLTVINDD